MCVRAGACWESWIAKVRKVRCELCWRTDKDGREGTPGSRNGVSKGMASSPWCVWGRAVAGAQAAGAWVGGQGVRVAAGQRGGWRDWFLTQEVWGQEARNLFSVSAQVFPMRVVRGLHFGNHRLYLGDQR